MAAPGRPSRRTRWSRRRVLSAALLAAGLGLAAQGLWIPAKALLAQHLLARAWSATLAGETGVQPWPWADTYPVARLEAPRLGARALVLSGAGGRTLAFGPGHVAGTAAPGAPGNSVLGGHRDTHFAFLRDLQPGDVVIVETADGRRHRYRVEGSRIVDHRDGRAMAPSLERRLTLVTCYPFDTVAPGGPLRWVVEAVGEGEA